jgi:hypothetical protein
MVRVWPVRVPNCLNWTKNSVSLTLRFYLILSRKFGFVKIWRANGPSCEPFSSNDYLTDFVGFSSKPLYKDRCFLHQKYVVEGLSIAQISSQIFSSKEAVRQNLIRFGIPIREAHKPHGHSAQMKFGKQMRQGKVIPHLAEKRVIEAVVEMRRSNMSLRQIAKFLSKVGVPTKRRGVAWHPEMVKRLLSSSDEPTVNGRESVDIP